MIPKGHNTEKWRLITDLSCPAGLNVNDGIDPELCSLSYTTVDDVAEIVSELGKGILLAKVNIVSAYRLIPVHPQDCPFQAMEWQGRIYVDPMLPFGLHSAPKIFNAKPKRIRFSNGETKEIQQYFSASIKAGKSAKLPDCWFLIESTPFPSKRMPKQVQDKVAWFIRKSREEQ